MPFVLLSLLSAFAVTAQGQKKDRGFMNGYPLRPVAINAVKLNDGFFADRVETHLEVTFPYVMNRLAPFIHNHHREVDLAKGRPAKPEIEFRGGGGLTLARALEGAGYSLMCRKDPKLVAMMDKFIASVDDIVDETGSCFFGGAEASVVYYWATGKDKYMKASEKIAAHTRKEFFDAKGNPIKEPHGHGGMEFVHARLYQGTGDPKYLEMALKFAEMRGMPKPDGSIRNNPKFSPQHLPVDEFNEPGGHAGSFGWFASGLVDMAALTGNPKYTAAVDRLWQNLVDTKVCITGGVGGNGGIEGFGPPYYVHRGGYNETCAASGQVFYNHRLFLLTKDAKYFDVMEIVLLNGLLSGVGLEGNTFFYINPLEVNGHWGFNMQHQKGRFPWWKVVCCPGSISRTVPQVPGYMYAHSGDDLYLTLYAATETEAALTSGKVKVKQETKYPFEGKIAVTIDPAKDGQRFALRLRIPTWAREKKFLPGKLYTFQEAPPPWTIQVNGKVFTPMMEKGFAVLDRSWKTGDKVQLDLPMPVQFSTAYNRAVAYNGRVAVTRGPFVFCAEEIDNGMQVQRLAVPQLPKPEQVKVTSIKGGLLDGMPMISFPGVEQLEGETLENREFRVYLAQPLKPYEGKTRPATIRLVPYFSWNNRGEKSMTAWIPHKVEAGKKGEPLPWVSASKEKAPVSLAGNVTAITLRNKSGDAVKIYWVGYKGELVQYGELDPGGTREQNTYSNATWLITDKNDKPLGHFITGPFPASAVIPAKN